MKYEEFKKNLADKIVDKQEWRDLATFVPNKRTPVYNWFYYKEGFAKQLVEELMNMFSIDENCTVFDPFCGSGTTLLACKQHNINSVGVDVLPISVFASRVKTANYDVSRLREAARSISRTKFFVAATTEKFPGIFYKAFNKYALQDIIFLEQEIRRIDRELREFFTLALINASLKCSFARKDGSVIKIQKRPVAPLRKMFRRSVSRMIKDVEKSALPGVCPSIELGDARMLSIQDDSIDAVITSPPYLNQIDYTKVYAIEEHFIRGEAVPGVRAYIGLKPKESDFLPELELPVQARIYFEDMFAVIKEMYRVLKNGGHAAIVVGNGYVDGIIDSDIILAYLAENIGFTVENVYVLNTRFALEDRTTKRGILRESLIILRK